VVAAVASGAGRAGVQLDTLPPIDLLTSAAVGGSVNVDHESIGHRLVEALNAIGICGEYAGHTQGPTVTSYEIVPCAGTKVRQIEGVAKDLALAMRASSVRIVAPIPGKGAVGVEVPNPAPEIVNFRELLETPEFASESHALPIALGRDVDGRPVIADLAKMPHLLIGGATGSGKSVCVNTIITSLIFRHTPRTLQFLMVDPKMVELSVYNILPHLLHKVVTDIRDAAAVLKWAVVEMHERYQLLAANGARNIRDFNQKVREGAPLKKPGDQRRGVHDTTYAGGILPYIVVVIDELADLMMTSAAEVEAPLAMLAQKSRAIGIHLILATQRPTVNVITGLIKANFPSRIAFRVAAQVDSRVVIGGPGAETLLGDGDMLFLAQDATAPLRVQGSFLASAETDTLLGWFRCDGESTRAVA
jgi:S-DNA-T family DNA segregation ATPase FtsK/SpoIIIE